jgi:hypothetical protein
MTAVAIGVNRGANLDQSASYTILTSAPTASTDIELRYQLLDANGKQLTKLDLILALKGIIRGLERDKSFFATAVTGTNFTGPQI